jgi:glutathione S-transferase
MSDTALPVLYSFRRCPYAMRARLALLVSGVAYETREVSLKHKPAHLLQLSPKGTVPVLWQPTLALGQQVLDESLAIMLWALRQHDPQQWLTPDASRMQQSLDTIERNDRFFKTHLDRYKYPQRFGLAQGLDDRDLACNFLCAINHSLDVQGFLNGPRWGLADAAIAPFVRQFSKVDPVWFQSQNWPALQAWLATFEASESFLKIMQKTSAGPATPPHL